VLGGGSHAIPKYLFYFFPFFKKKIFFLFLVFFN